MKNRNKHIALILVLCFLFLLSGCAYSYNFPISSEFIPEEDDKIETGTEKIEENGFSLVVNIGYNRFVKSGRFSRVFVEVSGNEDLEGKLIIKPKYGDVDKIIYAKELQLKKGETKRVEMAAPFSINNSVVHVSLADETGKVLVSEDMRINLVFPEDGQIFIGILTEKAETIPVYQDGVKAFMIRVTDFPEIPEGLNSLDMLLLDPAAAEQLNDKQKQALEMFQRTSDVKILEEGWDKDPRLLDGIEEELNEDTLIRLQNETSEQLMTNTAQGSLRIKDPEKIPKIYGFMAALIIYLLLIIPVYFVLKKIDKRGGLWIVVPMLSILFTLIIFSLGHSTRLTVPYSNYLKITEIGEESTAEENYFSLSSPYNKEYDVNVSKNYDVMATQVINGYMGNSFDGYLLERVKNGSKEYYDTIVEQNDEATSIKVVNDAAFSTRYFKSVSVMEGGKLLESNLAVSTNYKVTGTVTNNSDYDLTNACLSVGDIYIPLGDIKNQETIRVDDFMQIIMANPSTVYSVKMESFSGDDLNTVKKEERAGRIYYAYQYFFEKRMAAFLKKDVAMIGFTDEEENSGLFLDSEIEENGIHMIVMEDTADYEVAGGAFIPNLDPYMICEDTGYYNTYRYMNGERMEFRLQLKTGSKIKTLIYSEDLNSEFKENSYSGFYGTVKAYNHDTEQYDILFRSGRAGAVTHLNPYLDPENSIQLLFESDLQQAADKAVTIPVLSAIKEEP